MLALPVAANSQLPCLASKLTVFLVAACPNRVQTCQIMVQNLTKAFRTPVQVNILAKAQCKCHFLLLPGIGTLLVAEVAFS